METLIRIILGECVVLLALLIIFLLMVIWLLLRKIVVVPTLAVVTDKPNYFRGETVMISGSLSSDGLPIVDVSVALAIKPPEGDVFSLPPVQTDAEGNFKSSWDVPNDAGGGSYEITATALSVSATTTFTLN